MKRLLIFLSILCLISCTQHNNINTIVQIQEKNVSPELIEQTRQQVVERLKKAGFENIRLGRGTSPVSFEVSAVIEAKNEYRLTEYHDAFKRSEFGIWHKFKMKERDADSLRFPLAKAIPELRIDASWIGPKLSYNASFYTNKKYIDSLLSVKKKFNSLLEEHENIRLFWSAIPEKMRSEDEYYELHIIDTQGQSSAKITNEHINEATGKTGIFPDSYVVSISLNEEGGAIFEKMTRENIGEEIAITVDDRIYSAPLVQTEITGGKVDVSGSQSLKEAKKIATLVSQAPLPYTLKIIDESITPL